MLYFLLFLNQISINENLLLFCHLEDLIFQFQNIKIRFKQTFKVITRTIVLLRQFFLVNPKCTCFFYGYLGKAKIMFHQFNHYFKDFIRFIILLHYFYNLLILILIFQEFFQIFHLIVIFLLLSNTYPIFLF